MAKWYKYGRYYLLRHIATGGMAEIFLSKQIGLEGFEKLLVIKKILAQYAENQEFINMFLDEARLAAKLDHPNVVRIYDLGKQGNSYYIAMEYIAGEDLRNIMKKISQKGQLIPIQHTLHMISSLCEGLDYAHKKKDPSGKPLNIIHRDVSPQNIMVSYEGSVKILDFGIAKAANQSTETEAGVLKGKYAYMSPEQAKGKKLDHRSDVFAVGILLFEMLTNHRLFKAGNQLDTLRKLVYEDIPSPQKFNPNINDKLSEIVMKALEKDVEKRYQTARDFQNDIEEYLAQEQLISSSTKTSQFMQELFSEELKNLQLLEQKIEEEQKEVLATDLPDISQDSGLFEPGTGFSSFHMRQNTALSSWNKTGITGTNASSNMNSQSGVFSAQAPVMPNSSSKIIIISLLILILLGGVGVFAYIFFIKKDDTKNEKEVVMEGRLSINTNPSGAVILIDGKTYKDKSPAIVEKLPVGKPIVLKIQKEGYADIVKEVLITNPSQLYQETIELKVEDQKVQYGIVKVSSNPEGAEIYLDNKKIGKKTNTILQEVTTGQHNVLLELEGHDPYFTKFTVKADELEMIDATLYKKGTVRTGFVSIDVNIDDAEITIDGKQITQPVKDYPIQPDTEVKIAVKKSGYTTYTTSKTLKIGDHELIKVEMKKPLEQSTQPGSLTITTMADVNIIIDGKNVGTGSANNISLKPGNHTIKLESKAKMLNYTTYIKIQSGKSITKDIQLQKGKLAVSVKPWADVYVNGKKIGTTPFPPMELYEGDYTIKLENPKGSPIIKEVTVKAGETKLLMEQF